MNNIVNRTDGRQELNLTEDQVFGLQVGFLIYTPIGLMVFAMNLPIFLVVAIYKKLRHQKEYIMVASLALADSINGFGYLVAGVWRSILIEQKEAFILVSRWDCFMAPQNLIWVWAEQWAMAQLLTITIDRLIAVFLPIKYFKFRAKYASIMCGITLGICVVGSGYGGLESFFYYRQPEKPAFCYTRDIFGDSYKNYFYFSKLFCVFGSVIFYVPVIIKIFGKKANKDPRQTQQSLDQQRKRLMKVTKTISISVVATLVFCVVPDVVAHLDLFDNLTPFYIMFNFNPMANFFIYAWHFNDIRSGIKSLFCCRKKLPVETVTTVTVGMKPTRTAANQAWGQVRVGVAMKAALAPQPKTPLAQVQ